jgi:hypothetical protein
VNRVIVVAPVEASWALRASEELSAAHLLIARVYEPTLVSLLIEGASMCTLAIDSRVLTRTLQIVRRATNVRLLLVHEGPHEVVHGAMRSSSWPTSMDSVRTLIGA